MTPRPFLTGIGGSALEPAVSRTDTLLVRISELAEFVGNFAHCWRGVCLPHAVKVLPSPETRHCRERFLWTLLPQANRPRQTRIYDTEICCHSAPHVFELRQH